MIKLEVHNNVDPTLWNSYVTNLDGTFAHTYEYSLFSQEIYGSIPLFFIGRSDAKGDIISLAVGKVNEKKFGPFKFFQSITFGSLPAAKHKDMRNEMLAKIMDYVQKQGIMVLNMNSFSTPYHADIFNSFNFSLKKRWEFLLPLNQTEDALWKNISPKKRNKIRKGKKKNLTIKPMTDRESILELRNLEHEIQRRKVEQGIDFSVADESYFMSLKNIMIDKGIGKLYLAFDDSSQCVAGAFFGTFNNKAYYMLSAANEEGLKLSAPDAILWESIIDFMNEGYNLFNFGGISESELFGKPLEEAGLYVFKKSYNSTPHLCYHGNLCLRPTEYAIYNFLKK